jgi:hypothetical protein
MIEMRGRKKTHNESLHWIFTPLRCVKTSEFKRYVSKKNESQASICYNINIIIIGGIYHGQNHC